MKVSAAAVAAVGSMLTLGSPPALATATAKQPTAAQVKSNVAALYKAAKKEGSVNVDVLTSTSSYAAVISGFEKKYPGISVNLVNVAGPTLASTIISQTSTDNLTTDLVEARPEVIGKIRSRKLIARPDWAEWGVPASELLLSGGFVHTSDFVTAVVYNPHLLSKSQVPKSWKSLLAPAWSSGHMIIDGAGTEGFESMLVSGKWTLKEYTSFLKQLKAQNPIVIYQGAPETIALAQGQAPIGLVPLPVVSALIAKGEPLAVAPVKPVVSSPDGWFVMKGAHHTAAAELLATYFSSAAAKPLFATGGFTAATPPRLGGEAAAIGAGGLTAKNLVTLDKPKSIALFEQAEKLNISILGFTGS
jgi:ABC-type Fe3+ transport system substrate-binding protein